MDDRFSVAVVGAGPAGSSAALYLKQHGVRVALIDKAFFPRDKACGDGIPFKTVRLLNELGISEQELFENGQQVSRMEIYGPSGDLLVFEDDSRSAGKNGCIPRKHFDNLLFRKAAQVSDAVFQGHQLLAMKKEADFFALTLKDKKTGRRRTIRAQLVIGADGGNSRVARLAGLLKRAPQHHFDGLRGYFKGNHFGDVIRIFYDKRILPGYVWIFPVSTQTANVGIMTRRKGKKEPGWLQKIFYEIIDSNNALKPYLQGAQPIGPLRGAPMPLGTLTGVRTADGVLLIGDAAAFINPLTGGGIYWAVLSAKKAAQVATRALADHDISKIGLKDYERWWRKTLLPGFQYSAVLAGLLSHEKNASRIFKISAKYRPAANLFAALYGR